MHGVPREVAKVFKFHFQSSDKWWRMGESDGGGNCERGNFYFLVRLIHINKCMYNKNNILDVWSKLNEIILGSWLKDIAKIIFFGSFFS